MLQQLIVFNANKKDILLIKSIKYCIVYERYLAGEDIVCKLLQIGCVSILKNTLGKFKSSLNDDFGIYSIMI